MSEVVGASTKGLTWRSGFIAGASLACVLDVAATGVAGLKPIDAVLVMAINQANIAPLRRDADARARYGALEAPADDAERRPVSINAVAASLGLPFETVRRRIRRLCADGVCRETSAGVLVPASFLASPRYLTSVMAAHARLRALYFELKRAGLAEGLPASAYDVSEGTPVRAAAALLSDYLLRTFEALMREAGDVIAALILLALMAEALAPSHGGTLAQGHASVRKLHRRIGLPEETVRRHALELVEEGACVRGPLGFSVTEATLADPGMRSFLADNEANVQRLFSALAERGLVAAWEREAA